MATRHERLNNKALNDEHSRILRALMARSDNRRCVDCRKKDPRWASWNLGVFMCIRCSGIHRSIGTHITKVKSADLDTWTPEQIENMIKWGNAKANAYWEGSLPSGFEGPPESGIDQWIRDKYNHKRFALRGPIPDPDTISLHDGVAEVEVSTKSSNGNDAATPHLTAAPETKYSTPVSSAPVQDLLDIFAPQPVTPNPTSTPIVLPQQQKQSDLKSNIMSLYGNSQTTQQQRQQPQVTATPQLAGLQFFSTSSANSGFANFAAFNAGNSSQGLPSSSNGTVSPLSSSLLQPALGSALLPNSSVRSAGGSSSSGVHANGSAGGPGMVWTSSGGEDAWGEFQ